ncbi:phage tail protein [uncultured Amphritea sp.]|uniref:phage tail protein n=1 Tax=uncultured Amphritea sp. TaxID=981605 RepID=UPI0025E2144E|nr:phage tail protein [uncultured Amphritea sp.]
MIKLQSLTQHMLNLNLFDPEQMDSWAEEGTLIPARKDTDAGMMIGRWRYRGVISLERYSKDAGLLMAAVLAWLTTDDDRVGLDDPTLDPDPAEDGSFFVDITVSFQETIYLVPDETGPYLIDGQKFGLGAFDLWVAENSTTHHAAAEPA